jgi:hypothetical protein
MRSSWLIAMLFVAASGLFANVAPTATSSFSVAADNSAYTELNFNLPAFELVPVQMSGREYQQVSIASDAVTMTPGFPELPVFSTTIAVPANGDVSLRVTDSQEYTLTDTRPIPSAGMNETRSIAPDEAYYQNGAAFPENPVRISDPAIMRDMRLVTVSVCPFVYDPSTNSLRVRQHCSVRVEYSAQRGVNELTRSMKPSLAFREFYQTVENYHPTRDEADDFQQPCILFVCRNDNNLLDVVNQISEWKHTKGFETHILTYGNNTSATTIRNDIQNAYQSWDNPPEYVVLIGDVTGQYSIPCWYETESGYSGATDHKYSMLDGTDILPEVLVGRISISSMSDIQTYLSKINIYERAVNTSTPGMFNHSIIAGDVNPSGLSCIQTVLYVKDCIRSWDPDHTFTEELGSVSPANIDAAINAGSLFFAYRGYIGCSGWQESDINALTNSNKLINAVVITCDTGAFEDETSRIETLIRVGTPAAPRGAISAIGMSTSHTHTQFNNILEAGIFYGLYSDHMHTMGAALMRGKLALYNAYANVDLTQVFVFSHWCNMMGDPSCDVWHATPLTMNANYSSTIPLGQSYIDIAVTDSDGVPVADAWVTAYLSSPEVFATGRTTANGTLYLRIPPEATGTINLTVTKPDYLPILGSFAHTATGTTDCSSVTIDDATGNDNNEANPGETIGLGIGLTNHGSSTLTGINATLATDDEYVTVTGSTSTFPNINAGSEQISSTDFVVHIREDAPDRHSARFNLSVTDGAGNTTVNPLWLEIHGCDLDPGESTVSGGSLTPGSTVTLNVPVLNHGRFAIDGVEGVLSSTSDKIEIQDSTTTYGNIAVAGTANGVFTITGLSSLIPGMTIPFTLRLFNTQGYEETESFNITAGTPTVTDPLGPDDGGYLCFDDGDIGYADRPTYNWIEIDPAYGGTGTNTGLSDQYDENDAIIGVELPFPFRYYGITYEQIGVCTNGFISFPLSEQSTFRNWPIPGPKGPSPMIAAMWDDLRTTGGGIFTYYAEDIHGFVIEWSHCSHPMSNAEETFEIILFDPQFYPTPSMNGPFKIQYKAFHNDDTSEDVGGPQGNYCTIGTEDSSERIGLQYTYDNSYPTAAKPITDETALYFTGIPVVYEQPYLVMSNVVLHDADGSGYLDAGERADLGIRVNNLGRTIATQVHGTLTSDDANLIIIRGEADYPTISNDASALNSTDFTVRVAADCPDNYLGELHIQLSCATRTWSYDLALRVHRPAVSVASFVINDADGNADGIADPGESITLGINLKNSSRSFATNLHAQLTSQSADASVSNPEVDFGTIIPGMTLQKPFTLVIAPTASAQSIITLTLSVTNDSGLNESLPVALSISQEPSIVDEDFAAWADHGWEIDDHASNWTTVTTSMAGGSSPELMLTWSPSWDGTSRFMTPAMNLMGATDVSMSFRQYIDLFQNGGVAFSVQARSSESEWQTLWEEQPTNNVGPELRSVVVPSALVAQPGLQLCFCFTGNVYYINGWYLDDVTMNATLGNSAVVSGTVNLLNGPGSLDNCRVSLGELTVHPDSTGAFTLLSPAGTYPGLSATHDFYETASTETLTLGFGDNASGYAFSIAYLTPAHGIAMNRVGSQVTLNWAYEPAGYARSRLIQRNDTNRTTFTQFEIWQQIDTGEFELADSTTELTWSTIIDTTRAHEYYVVVEYAEGLSDSTRHVSLAAPEVGTDDPAQTPRFTRLTGNYPNPFNPETRIAFSLAERSPVELTVYNIRGEVVRHLLRRDVFAPGEHTVSWNGLDDHARPVSSGVYLYRFSAGGTTAFRRATLLK